MSAEEEMTREEQAEAHYRAMVRRHRQIFGDVVFERIRQEAKFGVSEGHPSHVWFRVLAEEFGEVARCLNQIANTATDDEAALLRETQHLREELIQTAASGIAWVEDWDRAGAWS